MALRMGLWREERHLSRWEKAQAAKVDGLERLMGLYSARLRGRRPCEV